MKPSKTVLLVLVVGLLASACQKQRDANTAVQNPGDSLEHKTVELVEKGGESKLMQHSEEWNNAGWAIVSVSKLSPRPDGTVLRKIELTRPKR